MGYGWNGVCYQTPATALEAFAKQVPKSDAAGINAFTAAPTINGTGLITWSISNRPLNGTTATTRTGTTQLLTCTDSMDQWPVQSTLYWLALLFACFIGFRTGFRP